MWYFARAELGIDRISFLAKSPAELAGLLDQIRTREQRNLLPAALICSVIANVSRDPEQRSEPYTVADFLPRDEGSRSKEEEMMEFIDALQRGETFEDQEAMDAFKTAMKKNFNLLEQNIQ